jgi:hypothetical protein
VRAEDKVVVEGEFEPLFQVGAGERQEEPAQAGRGEPEALEPGGGIEVLGGGESLEDAQALDHRSEHVTR